MRYSQVKPWLGKLNRWILQWFCIRLAAIMENEPRDTGEERLFTAPGILPITGWQIMYPIIPLTGWTTPYYTLDRKKIRHITLWRKKR